MTRWLLPLVMAILVAQQATATGSVDALSAAQARLAAAERPAARLVALGDLASAYQTRMADLRANLRAMPARRQQLLDRLGPADGASLAALGALYRALGATAGATLAHPAGPLAAIRARTVLAGMASHAARQVTTLREAVDGLDDLARERRSALAALDEATTGLSEARREIAAALAAGEPVPPPDAPVDIRSLATRLAAAGPDPVHGIAQRSALISAKGRLPLPAEGVARRDGFGILLRISPSTVVRSPALATVRHAGPLRPLGEVVVLEPAPGALIVIQGLDGLRVSTGAVVQPDQPVGLFEGAPPAADAYVNAKAIQAGGNTTKTLYIEFWLDGHREDAAVWFDLDPQRPARLQ